MVRSKIREEYKINQLKRVLEKQPELTIQQLADTLKWGKTTVIKYKKFIAEQKTEEIINAYGGKVKELKELLEKNSRLTNKQIAAQLGCDENEVIEYKIILNRLSNERERKIEKVKELRQENPNITYKEIASILQCGIDTINTYIEILKERGEFKTKQELIIEKIEKLLSKSPTLSNEDLARIIQCSESSIEKYRNHLEKSGKVEKKKDMRQKVTKEEQIERVKQIKQENPKMTYKEIGEKLGLTVTTIYTYMNMSRERGKIERERNEKIQKVKELKEDNPEITNREIQEIIQCSNKTVKRYIQLLEDGYNPTEKLEITETEIKTLCREFTGENYILEKMNIYLSRCKKRQKDIRVKELPTIKEVVSIMDDYDNIVFYINLCIKCKKIEEAIFFANGQIYNENFTKEQQATIRKMIVSMKEIHKKQQALEMLRRGVKIKSIVRDTGLPEIIVIQLNNKLTNREKKPTESTQESR